MLSRIVAGRAAAMAGLLLAVAVASGCAAGVKWEFTSFQEAQQKAAQENKPTFVYLRSWYLVECTKFEEETLKDPEVLAETQQVVCVPLDFDCDQVLAKQWSITSVPAFVIVSPKGELLARAQGVIGRAVTLEALRAACKGQATALPKPPNPEAPLP